MKVLIDTNILIPAEGQDELPSELQKLFQLIHSINAEIYCHQASLDDISRDDNIPRRNITVSKLSKYKILPMQQVFSKDSEFTLKVGAIKTPNDQTDVQLLFSVYCKAVDFLVTNDQKLIGRSIKVGCSEKVLDVLDAVNIFEGFLLKGKVPKPIALEEVFMDKIDYKQSFFDSLRSAYPAFDSWFAKKAQEKRKAFVHRSGDEIDAILVLKAENDSIPLIERVLPSKRRLKICLLKSDLNRSNIGELFIKISIATALQHNIDEIYITHFAKGQDYLVSLIERFGFKYAGKQNTNNGQEEVFIKSLIGSAIVPEDENGISEFNRIYYPSFYDGKIVKKYVVPIKPEFYERLFPERESRQTMLMETAGQFLSEGNAIGKAYICNAKILALKRNDLLVFYLSGKNSAATLIGTVESTCRSADSDAIAKEVARRTVYSKKEISKMTAKGAGAMAILFRLNFHFPKQCPLTVLEREKILNGPPQSITEISHEKYIKLKELSQLDSIYTVSRP